MKITIPLPKGGVKQTRAGASLVLERRTPAESLPEAAAEVEFRRRGRIAFGEWAACDTPLCNQDWGLSLRIRKSVLGELRSLIPEMAEAPFLVSPRPVNVSPTRLLLPDRATATLRPRRFRVVSGGSEIWYEREIEFGIVDEDMLRPLTLAPDTR